MLDTAKIRVEARLDGKYLLVTSGPDLSAEDVALGYKNLLEGDRGFRDLKSTLELRPVYHRLEQRIRAHVLLSWLALLLIRVAERRTGQTWSTLARELGRLHAVTLTGADRHGHPDHRAHHRPAGHSSRLRTHPAAPGHRPTPGLSWANAAVQAAGAGSDTPPTPLDAHFRSSTPIFGARVDLPTAEPGFDACVSLQMRQAGSEGRIAHREPR
jgi:hypothetical protein